MIRRMMIFGAAALTVAAVSAGSSQATAPGKNGRIAFQRYELHDAPYAAHIMVTNSNGSGQRTITHAPEGVVDDQPDWAPDGSRIVFERCAHACKIWTISPNGRNPKRLTPCPHGADTSKRCPDDSNPAYSPDGRRIAFKRYTPHTKVGPVITVADAHLRHPHVIGPGWDPGWSPNGKQLVFDSKPGAFQAIFVASPSGRGQRRVTPWHLRAESPDWSPDGSRILFVSGPEDRGNLYTIRPDGTGLHQLTHFTGETRVSVGSYSPDGSSIVFSTRIGAVNPPGATLMDVFVMSADGTDIRPVTRARNLDESADWGPRR